MSFCICEGDTGYIGPCHGELPDVAACFHCGDDLDEATVVEAIGEKFCSTFCATMAVRHEHSENCYCAADGLTLAAAVAA